MSACKTRTTLLLNWYANPYHCPIFIGKALGFYEDEGLQLAILEPDDPSDVTEIVGLGQVDFGLKAMIHTIAANAKGFDITSIGTLLDEPPTGLVSKEIHSFEDLKGKRIGYIGHFGKIIVDDLFSQAGLSPTEYSTVRVGMNGVEALKKNQIDAGIGFINFQKIEIEDHFGEVGFLRIDEMAGLGCCCFCSVMIIANSHSLHQNPEVAKAFMRATQRAMAYTTENPEEAYAHFCAYKPKITSAIHKKIFFHTLPFFSRNLLNVKRDWDKVERYAKHLQVVKETANATDYYTNDFVPSTPYCSIKPVSSAIA